MKRIVKHLLCAAMLLAGGAGSAALRLEPIK